MPDLNALYDSAFLGNTFLAINCVLHMLLEEREDFFRMPSEVQRLPARESLGDAW